MKNLKNWTFQISLFADPFFNLNSSLFWQRFFSSESLGAIQIYKKKKRKNGLSKLG